MIHTCEKCGNDYDDKDLASRMYNLCDKCLSPKKPVGATNQVKVHGKVLKVVNMTDKRKAAVYDKFRKAMSEDAINGGNADKLVKELWEIMQTATYK